MLNFYDFEVFKEDWLVVIINPIEKEKTVIVNDREKLLQFHDEHKNEIWIGWNSRNYDQYILKGIILDINPKIINDAIILKGYKGYQIDSRFKTIPLNNYDCKFNESIGLKQVEGFLGNNIHETSIPFDIDRKLTPEELAETIKYCTNDVEQTIEIFLQKKDDFESHFNLIKNYKLPLDKINCTSGELTADILGCVKSERYDEFDLQTVDCLEIEKYKNVVNWFKQNIGNYDSSLQIEVCGKQHVFGWGGLHSYHEKAEYHEGLLIHIDVDSYYPSIMIEHNFLTRNCKNPKKFKEIYDTRMALKKAGKKKEQAPLKILLNSTYGICKYKYSKAYDPLQANNVCVNGQLMLLDLLEKLENHCELIQSNTDGIIIKIKDDEKSFTIIDDICFEWEQRTKMKLSFETGCKIWQKDVNNYIFQLDDGTFERKGGYVKELSALDYDLPIINKAVFDFLTKKIPVEKTVNECNSLIEFQKIVKVSSKYKYAYHNGIKYDTMKTFRIFASKNANDSFIGKQKEENATIEKFANTPEKCFIDNSDVKNKSVPLHLNKQWYIDLALKRIEDFQERQLSFFE